MQSVILHYTEFTIPEALHKMGEAWRHLKGESAKEAKARSCSVFCFFSPLNLSKKGY